jgi:hypothetical protein
VVTPDFEKWALGFSGCDGGNLEGKIWLCGIEYGGGNSDPTMPFPDAAVPSYVGGVDYSPLDFQKYAYNWKALKLLASIAGHRPDQYKAFFKNHSCFDRHSDYFKLNIYPIDFKTTAHHLWDKWVAKTGIATKEEYLEWCREFRFKKLRAWLLEYSPRLIICTGKQYFSQFWAAFGDGTEEIHVVYAAGKEIRYFATDSGKTLVAVIYFLGGRFGLRSDAELSQTGAKLASLIGTN